MLKDMPSLAPPDPVGQELSDLWCLDRGIDYLNHGCFGARTRPVVDAQAAWRDRIEAHPVAVLDRDRDALLGVARSSLGAYVHAAPEDLGFLTNATGAVNAVLRSLVWSAGDEIVTTDHAYNAVRKTLDFIGQVTHAKVKIVPVPLPVRGPGDVLDPIVGALTSRTRLLLVDHITSPTALVLPVAELVKAAAERNIDVLVDGAHAPGMVDLDIESIGAAYYAGNLHKWLCAPLGSAFLWVRSDRHRGIHPNTISHFLDEGLADEFNWQGTRDISGWLSVPDAIEVGGRIGWDRIRAHNHQMATWVQSMLADRWGCPLSTPADGSMLGSMVTLPLPPGWRDGFPSLEAAQLHLYNEHQFEVPIFDWNDQWWIRPSCQIYNHAAQYERLADVVAKAADR